MSKDISCNYCKIYKYIIIDTNQWFIISSKSYYISKKYLSRREDFLKKGAKYSLHHIHTSNTHSFNSTFRYLLEDFTTELYP